VFAPVVALLITAAPAVAAPLIGDPAPLLDLSDLQGKRTGAWKYKHRATIVEFSATWCLPCGRSLEDLRAIRGELGEDVQVIIVSQDPRSPAVQKHFRDHPLPEGAVLLLDPAGDAGRRWGRDRFPTTFFINRDGLVRHIYRGYGPGYRDRVTRWLRGMLAPPS
jgi:cytochrome c biogenesis protein CcmG, thiol:disulfide interchange protein DsbE